MARATTPPAAPRKEITVDEMQKGIQRLKERIGDLDKIDLAVVTQAGNPPEVIALSTAVERTIAKIYGDGSPDFNRYWPAAKVAAYFGVAFGDYPAQADYRSQIAENIQRSKHLISQAIQGLEEEIADMAPSVGPAALAPSSDSNRVFLVHGRDDGTKETVARFVEKLGFDAVVLHERPSKGRTIITKFQEEARNVGFAIVLMTPDDEGGPVGGVTKHRARQNVVFELGFFIGILRPDRVVALIKADIERPSDFDGVVYISLDSGTWKADLAKEMSAAGLEIDWNKVMK